MIISFTKGYPEMVLSYTFDALLYIKMVDGLRNCLDLMFKNQVKHKESICWLFDYSGATLVLMGDLYQGISICPCAFVNYTAADVAAIQQLGDALKKWHEVQHAALANIAG